MAKVSEGVGYANRGDDSAAVRAFEEAAHLDPANAYAHYYLGLVRLQEFHAPDRALESLMRAAELAPGEAEIRYQIGVAHEDLGDREAARDAYVEATTLHDAHARAYHRLGRLSEGDGEIRDAIDWYTQAIFADPYFPWPYVELGNLYATWGRPQEAVQVFENGIANSALEDRRHAPGYAQQRADLGRVYLEMDEPELAITYLEQAVELHPQSSTHAFNLGIAYQRRYAATERESDRQLAVENLTRARGQCNPSVEPARCSSIAAALRDLRAAGDPR